MERWFGLENTDETNFFSLLFFWSFSLLGANSHSLGIFNGRLCTTEENTLYIHLCLGLCTLRGLWSIEYEDILGPVPQLFDGTNSVLHLVYSKFTNTTASRHFEQYPQSSRK
jgi:hypothetical protein